MPGSVYSGTQPCNEVLHVHQTGHDGNPALRAAQSQRPGCRAVAALVAVLMCAAAAAAYAQPPSPIAVFGQGVLQSVSPTGGETLTLALRMSNPTAEPVRVTRAETFLVCQGGWSVSLGEAIAKENKFFGNSPLIDPGEYHYEFNYTYSTPVSHFLLAVQLSRRDRPPRDYLLQVPFVRPGFVAPRSLRASAPVFIGLQEPIEVLTLSTGEVWLPIVGQIINTSGRPLTVRRWHIGVTDSAGNRALDREPTAPIRVQGSTESLNEFLFTFVLPREFRKGTLQIDVEIDLGGRRIPLARPADLERVEARAVQPPVEGRWFWRNGPGERTFHSHYHYPEQRYCYDLTRPGGNRRATYSGDPNQNESYFAWDQPIHCVEDGKVRAVIDNVPDNFGQRANPANNPRRNSAIVVEHAGRSFSIYSHPRRGSAAVKVGQTVKAGDVLARVGNAGFSSEPHLHFGYMNLDQTGRFRNIPMRIKGLKSADGRPADEGVPKGGLAYFAPAEK